VESLLIENVMKKLETQFITIFPPYIHHVRLSYIN